MFKRLRDAFLASSLKIEIVFFKPRKNNLYKENNEWVMVLLLPAMVLVEGDPPTGSMIFGDQEKVQVVTFMPSEAMATMLTNDAIVLPDADDEILLY